VIAVGETREMSGEAESRSHLKLPGLQQQIIDDVASVRKDFAVVLFNGRPLVLSDIVGDSPAILEAWFGGIEAGNAVADVVFGKVNPGGKLPVSFPRRVGQVPIYYNHEPTGRPCDVTFRWNSRYRDILSCDPFYKFGFGLSYSKFTVTDLSLSSHTLNAKGGSITVSAKVNNVAGPAGDDVAQLYIHDPVASISQPVRRLRGFQRVTVPSGGSETVTWHLDRNDVGFYDNSGHFVVEPGRIDVYVGDSSDADMTDSFTVQ